MPPKKIVQTDQDEAQISEPTAKENRKCGHVNMHHVGILGTPQPLFCDLPPGHGGDHHAKYEHNVSNYITDEKGRVTSVKYTREISDGYWRDEAGTPPGEVGEVPQMSLGQKDILMNILGRNPQLPFEQALAKAKEDNAWAALGV